MAAHADRAARAGCRWVVTIIAEATASVGTFMPTTIEALGAAEAGFAGPIADIEAQIVGAAAASASVVVTPPSFDLAAAIEGALQLPGVSVDVTMMAQVLAGLNVSLGALVAALELVLAVQGDMGARVRFIATEGAVTEMAGDIEGVLAGDVGQSGIAVMLVAEDGGASAALRRLFGL
jgi:hypothetical protein